MAAFARVVIAPTSLVPVGSPQEHKANFRPRDRHNSVLFELLLLRHTEATLWYRADTSPGRFRQGKDGTEEKAEMSQAGTDSLFVQGVRAAGHAWKVMPPSGEIMLGIAMPRASAGWVGSRDTAIIAKVVKCLAVIISDEHIDQAMTILDCCFARSMNETSRNRLPEENET